MTALPRRVLLALAAVFLVTPPAYAQELQPNPTVTVVQIEGGIDASYAGFLVGEVHRAARKHDLGLVLRISSSGTVKTDVARLVQAIDDSPVPVVTWVGPKGAHVSGTAAFIWAAGDQRLVAPGARVALALPLTTGTAGTIYEAVKAVPGVDRNTTIRFAGPGPVVRVRQALATNPTLVYLLLLCGLGAIVFEAFQPGFGPAGYAGGLLVALAGYGLTALPISPIGLALVLLGVAAMALDVRRDAIGVPTWGGAVALAFGSYGLVHSHPAALRPAWWAIGTGTVGSLLFYGIVMTIVLRALRGQADRIGQALVGRAGEVRSTLNPQGHVLVDGALWRAQALEWDGPVPTGTRVRVTGVDEAALVLDVQPVTEGA